MLTSEMLTVIRSRGAKRKREKRDCKSFWVQSRSDRRLHIGVAFATKVSVFI
jgi:hypothetical protein